MSKPIYSITGICPYKDVEFYVSGPVRTWGFYHTLEEAQEVVENNYTDIFEGVYTKCVIEELFPGISEKGKKWKYEWEGEWVGGRYKLSEIIEEEE